MGGGWQVANAQTGSESNEGQGHAITRFLRLKLPITMKSQGGVTGNLVMDMNRFVAAPTETIVATGSFAFPDGSGKSKTIKMYRSLHVRGKDEFVAVELADDDHTTSLAFSSADDESGYVTVINDKGKPETAKVDKNALIKDPQKTVQDLKLDFKGSRTPPPFTASDLEAAAAHNPRIDNFLGRPKHMSKASEQSDPPQPTVDMWACILSSNISGGAYYSVVWEPKA
jgi:hypothetical protein